MWSRRPAAGSTIRSACPRATCAYRVTGTPVSGLLVWGDDFSSPKIPGLYGVTPQGEIVNFGWENNQGWVQSLPAWGRKAEPGSLVVGDDSTRIFGVDDQGRVVSAWWDDGYFDYMQIQTNEVIVPGSLVWGGSLSTNDVPGLYGENTQGQVVNFRWNGNQGWYTTVVGQDVVPTSLVLGTGGARLFGVNRQGQMIRLRWRGGQLNFRVIQ